MTIISNIGKPRESLRKTDYNDGRLVSADASSVLSLSGGAVEIYMSLSRDVVDGVYGACESGKYFTDYLIFAINPTGHFIAPPGMYAAFTPSGIEFTIWTLSGKMTILDTTTSVVAGTPFLLSFCWDYMGNVLGGMFNSKAAIFVDGTPTSSTNSPISPDSISGIELSFLDNSAIDYGLQCEIFDIVTYSSLPAHLRYSIDEVKYADFGNDYVAMSFADGIRFISRTTGSGYVSVNGVGSISPGKSILAISDSDRDLYVLSSDGVSGSVSRIDTSTGSVKKQLVGLSAPVCIGITQLGGIDYPRTTRKDPCRAVWICESDRVILASHDLVQISSRDGYSNIVDVIPTSDGRAWILDSGASTAYLISDDLSSEEVSISIGSPEFGGASIFNDLYVYDSSTSKIIKYTGGVKVNSASVSGSVISMDVRAQDGYVVAAIDDGTVVVYDGILKQQYSWSESNPVSDVVFARGYGRNNIYVVNDSLGKIIERTIWGFFASSNDIGDGIFLGSSVSLAYNNASVYSEVSVDASYDLQDGTITDVSMSHYKVDTIPVALTGGGDNDFHFIGSGMDRVDIPVDINPAVRKGARTKR